MSRFICGQEEQPAKVFTALNMCLYRRYLLLAQVLTICSISDNCR